MASAEQAVETVYRPPESTSGTWTSWIPLVTPYSGHSPQCSTKYWQYVEGPGRNFVAWDPGFGISVQDLRCVPEAATTVWDQDRLGSNSDTVVSIGPITCPEAFSQVATSVRDESMTSVACCPLGYNFREWKRPGIPGQCYSDLASGDIITIYTSDESKNWLPSTRQINSSTTVLAAHINGWIFATDQTSAPPALPTGTEATQPPPPVCSSGGGSTNSAVVLGIGIALAVVGAVVLAAGIVMMRRSKQALRRVGRAEAYVPSSSRLPSSQELPRCGSKHQTGAAHGGLFLPVPATARHGSTSQPDDKGPQELDGSHPSY